MAGSSGQVRLSAADIRAGIRPPSQRDRQKSLTRARILQAAADVLVEQGWSGTTVEAIADKAATTRGTFYTYFDSKADVLKELIAQASPNAADYYRRLDDVLINGNRDDLRAWLNDAIGWYESAGRLLAVWAEAETSEPEIRTAFRADKDDLAALLVNYASDQRHRPAATRIKIHLLIACLDRVFQELQHDDEWRDQLDVALDVLADMWWAAFQSS